jgi:hypothetical protein
MLPRAAPLDRGSREGQSGKRHSALLCPASLSSPSPVSSPPSLMSSDTSYLNGFNLSKNSPAGPRDPARSDRGARRRPLSPTANRPRRPRGSPPCITRPRLVHSERERSRRDRRCGRRRAAVVGDNRAAPGIAFGVLADRLAEGRVLAAVGGLEDISGRARPRLHSPDVSDVDLGLHTC